MAKQNFHSESPLKRNSLFSQTEKAIFWNGKSSPLHVHHIVCVVNLFQWGWRKELQSLLYDEIILANCPYLIGTVPILTQEKVGKRSNFTTCPYFCKNLSVVMYRKFRNVPIFEDFSPICPHFLGFRVGKYVKWKWMPIQSSLSLFSIISSCRDSIGSMSAML